MKRQILITTLIVAAFSPVLSQDNATDKRLNEILHSYLSIKDALVTGDSKSASASATTFIKNLNGISYTIISEANVGILLTDAATIADAGNIDKQRAAFVNFSANMVEVARALKLTPSPLYIQYCPMKKAFWLSNEKEIKNPYYGSSMLTCGNVADTIQ